MVFATPAGTGKMVVRVDYDVPQRGGTVKANVIGTGRILNANALVDRVKYEVLQGEI